MEPLNGTKSAPTKTYLLLTCIIASRALHKYNFRLSKRLAPQISTAQRLHKTLVQSHTSTDRTNLSIEFYVLSLTTFPLHPVSLSTFDYLATLHPICPFLV